MRSNDVGLRHGVDGRKLAHAGNQLGTNSVEKAQELMTVDAIRIRMWHILLMIATLADHLSDKFLNPKRVIMARLSGVTASCRLKDLAAIKEDMAVQAVATPSKLCDEREGCLREMLE